MAVPRQNLAERPWVEVEVALDGEASGPADFFHFGEEAGAHRKSCADNGGSGTETDLLLSTTALPYPAKESLAGNAGSYCERTVRPCRTLGTSVSGQRGP